MYENEKMRRWAAAMPQNSGSVAPDGNMMVPFGAPPTLVGSPIMGGPPAQGMNYGGYPGVPLLRPNEGTSAEPQEPLVSYTCRYPGCGKVYSSSDGARKHARNHHPEWLRKVEVQRRAVEAYCIRYEGPPRASPSVTQKQALAAAHRQHAMAAHVDSAG